MSSSTTVQSLSTLAPSQRDGYPTPGIGDGSFDEAIREAAQSNQGVISFDNFARFSTERGRSLTTVVNSSGPANVSLIVGQADPDPAEPAPVAAAIAPAPAPEVEVAPMSNRERFGDLYPSSNFGVVWDPDGDERRTPGGGNPDEIINLIYELKALGVNDAERFWQGRANGGDDHLTGFILLNQLKLSVMRSGKELLTPAEYRAVGAELALRDHAAVESQDPSNGSR
jgi:hypothetical protein